MRHGHRSPPSAASSRTPAVLSSLNVRDLHHLARLLCPSGQSDAVYLPTDREELAQAIAAERAEKKG